MLTPQIDNQLNGGITNKILPSKTYRINNYKIVNENRIQGYVDGLDAIKQAIFHILSIERYAYPIYDENYGIEFEQFIGEDLDYLKANIQQVLYEALTYDLRISNVTVTDIKTIDVSTVLISFTVESIYGNLVLEVNVNV